MLIDLERSGFQIAFIQDNGDGTCKSQTAQVKLESWTEEAFLKVKKQIDEYIEQQGKS